MADDRQRIDKWLWHARMVRTRSAAAALAAAGHVRVNGQPIEPASRAVRVSDVVTVALDRTVRVLRVVGFAERRGGAEAARELFEDLTPKAPPSPSPGAEQAARRERGSARPTKRERRELDRLRSDTDD